MQDRDDRHVLGADGVGLVHELDARLLVHGLARLVQLRVKLRAGVVRDVVAYAGVHERLQEVVHDGIVSRPTARAQLEGAIDVAGEHRRVLELVDVDGDAHGCPVRLHGDKLVRAPGGVDHDGERDAAAAARIGGIAGLVEKGVGLVDVIGGVDPGGLVVAGDSRRDDVARGGCRALVERVAERLAVDGKRHGLTHELVREDGVVHVVREVLGVHDLSQQGLLARRDGVAVLGLAVGRGGLLDAAGGDVAEVEVASLELEERGVGVLLDREVHAADVCGLVSTVVGELRHVDELSVLPRAVHHERAVAHGGLGVGGEVVLGAVGNRRQRGAAHHEREVGVRRGELDLERVVIGAGDARELVGLAVDHVVVALDQREVVRDDRRGVGGLRVADAVPGVLERVRGHVGAVVELQPLLDVEGPGVGGVVRVPGLCGEWLELLGGVVVARERVEELRCHCGAVELLDVKGVNARGVVDVAADRRGRGSIGGRRGRARRRGAGAAARARSETHRCARGRRPLDERAPVHGNSHFSSCLFRDAPCAPSHRPTRCVANVLNVGPLSEL